MYSGELLQIQNSTGANIVYNGTTYANGAYVPLGKFCAFEISYNKLWSSNTGRSMTGENKGTLIGIFPKIKVELGNMTEQNLNAIVKLTGQASASVKYFNIYKDAMVTASFYFGDVDTKLLKRSSMRHDKCSFSIIANKRMT